MAQAHRQTGTVKWFNLQKGFGFIAPEDGGEDLFVHQTSIQSDGFRSLSEGETVEFSVDHGDDGRTRATDVTGPNGSILTGGGGRRGGGGGGGGGGYGGNWGRSGGRNGGRGFGGGGGGRSCYKCGKVGHMARDCQEGDIGGGGGGGSCYNCGKFGHMARDCQEGGGGGGSGGGGRFGGGGGGGGCYNCGEPGHFARECPNGVPR